MGSSHGSAGRSWLEWCDCPASRRHDLSMSDPATRDRAVNCANCEAVCCRMQVLLMPGDRPPGHLVTVDPSGVDVMARLDDGWCAALDRHTMRCTIYTVRPQVCRDYEMGGPDCLSERAAWFKPSAPMA